MKMIKKNWLTSGKTCYLSRDDVQSLFEQAQNTFFNTPKTVPESILLSKENTELGLHIKYANRMFPLWVR
jgi:predicted alpha-1,6-mannanase (GH76 family)